MILEDHYEFIVFVGLAWLYICLGSLDNGYLVRCGELVWTQDLFLIEVFASAHPTHRQKQVYHFCGDVGIDSEAITTSMSDRYLPSFNNIEYFLDWPVVHYHIVQCSMHQTIHSLYCKEVLFLALLVIFHLIVPYIGFWLKY